MDKKYEWSMAHVSDSKRHPYAHTDLYLRNSLGRVTAQWHGFPCKDERVALSIKKALERFGLSPSDVDDPYGCGPYL